jgi:hypothetical protein
VPRFDRVIILPAEAVSILCAPKTKIQNFPKLSNFLQRMAERKQKTILGLTATKFADLITSRQFSAIEPGCRLEAWQDSSERRETARSSFCKRNLARKKSQSLATGPQPQPKRREQVAATCSHLPQRSTNHRVEQRR